MCPLLIAALSLSAPPRQPVREIGGEWKLVLRSLAIPGLPAEAYLVISQPNSADGPITVRLMAHSKALSRTKLPGWFFSAQGESRLFRLGGDYLLAFFTGSGTTRFTNFVRITASPPRVIAETTPDGDVFEYAPLHNFQETGRFEEHLRHVPSPKDLYMRKWLWSTRKHRFVLAGGARVDRWNGWDDESLR